MLGSYFFWCQIKRAVHLLLKLCIASDCIHQQTNSRSYEQIRSSNQIRSSERISTSSLITSDHLNSPLHLNRSDHLTGSAHPNISDHMTGFVDPPDQIRSPASIEISQGCRLNVTATTPTYTPLSAAPHRLDYKAPHHSRFPPIQNPVVSRPSSLTTGPIQPDSKVPRGWCPTHRDDPPSTAEVKGTER